MCRNIKPLFNFDPPVSDDEVRAAALQYVRKISGFNQPSKANEAAFHAAVDAVAAASSTLLRSVATNTPPRDRRAVQARLTEPERFRRAVQAWLTEPERFRRAVQARLTEPERFGGGAI